MRVLILGIGNVMFGDEGFGVHFVKMMERNFKFRSSFNDELEFMDGGTLALALTPIIASYDQVVVVDCISADDGEIGDVYFFDFEKIPLNLRWDGSAHEVEMLATLQTMQIAGDMPKVFVLAVKPERVEPMSFELSSQIQKASKIAQDRLLSHLSELGFKSERINNLNLKDLADEYAKKGLNEA